MQGLTQKHAQFRTENYINHINLGEISVSNRFWNTHIPAVHYYWPVDNPPGIHVDSLCQPRTPASH